jgi:murein peptide amidase A
MNSSAAQEPRLTDRLGASETGGERPDASKPLKFINNMSRPVIDPLPSKLAVPAKRSIPELLAPLERIAAASSSLMADHGSRFKSGGQTYELPRYLFMGPKGGDDLIRVGIFAGIHGDEPEGVHALIQFLSLLERKPELATGYCLVVYPVCNPTGFEDRTRQARSGKDLNREFWNGSEEPEVKLLQSELVAHVFDGIISLHTDDSSEGFYGFAHGATLTKNLIEPALQAAEQFLPRNGSETIDGFRARNGIIRDSYPGTLSAPPKLRPRPFEIVLETPQAPPSYLKEAALVAALRMVLTRYREFIAYAPNL